MKHQSHVPYLGIPNGIATLDVDGKLLPAQVPSWAAPRSNFSAVVDPTPGDDSLDGYQIGSRWINIATSPRREFVCVNATPAAAVWIKTTNELGSVDSPGQYFLGSILDYSLGAGLTANEIQYSRIYLIAGLLITKIQVFVDLGCAAGRNIRVGLYAQANPASSTGIPVTRVAQSDIALSTSTTDGAYWNIQLLSSYLVPNNGYYWAALVATTNVLKFVSTGVVYRQNFAPVRREVTTNITLPATAGTLTNPASAITYVAAME